MPSFTRISPARSSSLKLALGFTVLLVMSIITMVYFMGLALDSNEQHEVDAILATDIQGLRDIERIAGRDALYDVLRHRLAHPRAGVSYAVLEGDALVMGAVDGLPMQLPASPGEIFALTPSQTEGAAFAMYERLNDGRMLVVGRVVSQALKPHGFIRNLGGAMIGVMVCLALGGFFIGDRVVYRINLIASTAQHIIKTGDLTSRIPVIGRWDDLSKLALILNALIDRVEALMHEVRQGSDHVAHDLRTPLTRIKNQLEMLHDRGEDEQLGIEECTQKLISEADHMLDTFAALLRIRNIESGAWRSDSESLAMAELVHDVLEFYEPLAQEKGQRLHESLSVVSMLGQKQLLFQAVSNLLDNAIKYAPQGADIWVEMRRDEHGDDALLFDITNAGSHVDEDKLDDIFKRFYRTDTARSSQMGNGLGLSLVKAIAQHHGGTITAHNTERGFTISLRLPVG